MDDHVNMVIAHHLILTGYGHWLPNDPRGSRSHQLRRPDLEEFGPIHLGRKAQQPSKEELRAFHKSVEPHLVHPILWFDKPHRQSIGEAFAGVIAERKLTCYACAVMRNHAHLVIRRHALKKEEMIELLWNASRDRLRRISLAPESHPVWSCDAYSAFKHTPQEVRAAIDYIHRNFVKHRIPVQHWDFLKLYDNWPLHNR